jgi:hypothetical protein
MPSGSRNCPSKSTTYKAWHSWTRALKMEHKSCKIPILASRSTPVSLPSPPKTKTRCSQALAEEYRVNRSWKVAGKGKDAPRCKDLGRGRSLSVSNWRKMDQRLAVAKVPNALIKVPWSGASGSSRGIRERVWFRYSGPPLGELNRSSTVSRNACSPRTQSCRLDSQQHALLDLKSARFIAARVLLSM